MATNQGTIVSSISRTGAFEPFDLQVSRGQITFHEAFCQFGINGNVEQSYETLWVGSNAYTFPAAAAATTVSSSNAADTAAGAGARTVLIDGLNANYERVTEVASLNGQTGVALTNQYLRVNRITVLTAGANGTSSGFIYVGTGAINTGVPAAVINQTGLVANESESAFYTVPEGHTAFINRWTMSSSNNTANEATRFVLRVRPFGGVFGYKAIYNIPGNGIYECESAYPVALPEKSDLEIMALTTAGAAYVTTQLQIVLIKNRTDPGSN
jgi:hypothetical protein